MNNVKIYLVERHLLIREALKSLLESKNLSIIGEAGNATDAVLAIGKLLPDMVLLDIDLPDYSGIIAMKQIYSINPAIKVIAVTLQPENRYLLEFIEAGGAGYIHMSAPSADLLKAIAQVRQEGIYLSMEGVRIMADNLRSKSPKPKLKTGPEEINSTALAQVGPEILSDRERQVLGLLSRGYNSREIGEKLYLSPNTVETYKRRISEKLKIYKRSDLVAFAVQHKIYGDTV